MRTLLALAAFAILPALPANGQSSSPSAEPSSRSEAMPTPIACAPKAALYEAGKAPKVWVLRRGTMVLAENPLRPLSEDEAVVLEVVVNGRRATAYGPDLDHLRQGGSLASVEREGRGPVRWGEVGTAPVSIRVVAEDGRVLIGPLPFAGCEEAPNAKPIADAKGKTDAAPRGRRRGKEAAPAGDEPTPSHLPQGALPGLSLPKR